MTWYAFQRQYDARGREKGDGYSPGDFDELTPEERARARAMMLARALRGDTIDLSGLRYIGDAGTVVALRAADALDWDSDIIQLDVLFDLTWDERYLLALARYLDARAPDKQESAANTLSWRALPATFEPLLVARTCDGRHEGALLALLSAWIGLHEGERCDMTCFQRHLAFIRRVKRTAPRRRHVLLAYQAAVLARNRGRAGRWSRHHREIPSCAPICCSPPRSSPCPRRARPRPSRAATRRGGS